MLIFWETLDVVNNDTELYEETDQDTDWNLDAAQQLQLFVERVWCGRLDVRWTHSIIFHSIQRSAYLHLTYNLTAEQLRRDKHSQWVSESQPQSVCLTEKPATHRWWGWSRCRQGGPAGSPPTSGSSCWCGPSPWRWPPRTPRTPLGSWAAAPQTPSRSEPARRPCCCCWARRHWRHKNIVWKVMCWFLTSGQKWRLACRVGPPRTSCTHCSPETAGKQAVNCIRSCSELYRYSRKQTSPLQAVTETHKKRSGAWVEGIHRFCCDITKGWFRLV